MKRTYNKTVFGGLLVLLVLLCSCTGPFTGAKDKIRFGATISLTGSYAREGRATQQGYDVWADFVNEQGGLQVGDKQYQVEIVYYDDQSDPATAADLAEKLIAEDEVDFLLGPYSSPITMAVSEVAERYQVPIVEGAGASEDLFERGYKYLFAVLTPASDYMKALLERTSQLEPKPQTLAIATEDTIFPKSIAAGAQGWAAQYGIEVVAYEEFAKDATDLSPILTKFKALNPDIFIGTTYIETSMLLVRQAKKVDFSPRIMAFSVGPGSPSFVEGLGNDAEYTWGPTQWERGLSYKGPVFGSAADYAERFQQRYGEWPNYHNAEATAAAVAYQLALGQAGILDRQQVRDALASLDVETFFGPIRFDETGKNVAKPMVAVQIQNGQRVLVAPKEIQERDPIYPMPPWKQR